MMANRPTTRATDAAAADEAVLGMVMLAFDGRSLPEAVRLRLATRPAAGVTLFRYRNEGSPEEVRALTDEIQAAVGPAGRPLLVAADQEGGQLIALSRGTTPFAGNMALGAARDAGLAERVARAMGTELRAMGVNVDYAPACDLATGPAAPALGIRAFSDDPALVGNLAGATVRGLQSAGVVATAKHFPGMGDVLVDTHHGHAVVAHDRARLEAVELAPFRDGRGGRGQGRHDGPFRGARAHGQPVAPGDARRRGRDRPSARRSRVRRPRDQRRAGHAGDRPGSAPRPRGGRGGGGGPRPAPVRRRGWQTADRGSPGPRVVEAPDRSPAGGRVAGAHRCRPRVGPGLRDA